MTTYPGIVFVVLVLILVFGAIGAYVDYRNNRHRQGSIKGLTDEDKALALAKSALMSEVWDIEQFEFAIEQILKGSFNFDWNYATGARIYFDYINYRDISFGPILFKGKFSERITPFGNYWHFEPSL